MIHGGDLDGDLLRYGLDAIIKLGLTKGHSSEKELRLGLNKPCFNVLWPERRQLHSDVVELPRELPRGRLDLQA